MSGSSIHTGVEGQSDTIAEPFAPSVAREVEIERVLAAATRRSGKCLLTREQPTRLVDNDLGDALFDSPWHTRRISYDLTVTHQGVRWDVAQLPGVVVGESVQVRSEDRGASLHVKDAYGALLGISASRLEPVRTPWNTPLPVHSGVNSGRQTMCDVSRTAGPLPCQGSQCQSAPPPPARQAAHMRSHTSGTAGEAPGAASSPTEPAATPGPPPLCEHGSSGTCRPQISFRLLRDGQVVMEELYALASNESGHTAAICLEVDLRGCFQ